MLERWKLQLQRATLSLPVASPVWSESSLEKREKNNSDTPTSGSHNSLDRTPICANIISLESRRRELSNDMLHDPYRAPEGLQNCPPKSGQKTECVQKSRRIRWRGRMANKITTWRGARLACHHHALCAMVIREACNSTYKRSQTPSPISKCDLLGL